MSKTWICAAALYALLTACTDRNYAVSASAPDTAPAQEGEYLAHEHRVSVDVAEDDIETAYQAALKACRHDVESQCAVRSSELTKGDSTTAHISARLRSAGVEPLIQVAAKHGTIESRSTQSEDLAKPIVDSEKRLAMLEGYLADLLRLRQQSRNDVDALIKVTAEIAKTQSEIESLKGEHAQLRQRVELQVLNIYFFADRGRSYSTPIRLAFEDFWGDLASGVAQAITGFAFLLPWLIILVPLVLLIRYLWRKSR